MVNKKGKPVEIVIVNVFKNPEEDRKRLFLEIMAKIIAGSEKNLKIIPTGRSISN